jgi:hypothetical protein
VKRLLTILIAVFLPLAASHAALISVDTRFGSDTAALDTESGLEWLKPPVTLTPLFAITNELASGGKFEDYRYPTPTEFFCSLIGVHTGLACDFGADPNNLATFAHARSFVEFFFGNDRPLFENGAFLAIEPPPPGTTQAFLATSAGFIFKEDPVVPSVEFDSQQVAISTDRLNIPVFHWLVREVQAVPEPSVHLLFGLGFVALIISRKRMRTSQAKYLRKIYCECFSVIFHEGSHFIAQMGAGQISKAAPKVFGLLP